MPDQLSDMLGKMAAPVVRYKPVMSKWSYVGMVGVQCFRTALAFCLAGLFVLSFAGRTTSLPNLTPAVTFGYVAYVIAIWWWYAARRRELVGQYGKRMQLVLDLIFGILIAGASAGPGSSTYYFVFAIPVALSAWYSTSNLPWIVLVAIAASVVTDILYFPLASVSGAFTDDYFVHVAFRLVVSVAAWICVRLVRGSLREQAMAEARAIVKRDTHPSYLIRPDYTLIAMNAAIPNFDQPVGVGGRCYERLAHRSEPCDGCPVALLLANGDVQDSGEVSFQRLDAVSAAVNVTASRVLGHEQSGDPQAIRIALMTKQGTGLAAPAYDPSRVLALANEVGVQITALIEIAVSVLGQEDKDLPTALHDIDKRISEPTPHDGWYIALRNYRENLLVFPYFRFGDEEQTWRERPWSNDGFTESVFDKGRPRLVSDTRMLSRSTDSLSQGIRDEYPCHSWAGVPLAFHGQVFGVMAVRSPEPGRYGPEDLEELSRTAVAVAYAILRVSRRQQLLGSSFDFDAYRLPPISASPATDLLNAVVSPVLRAARRAIPFDTATLQMVERDKAVVIAAEGWKDASGVLGREFRLDDEDPNALAFRNRNVLRWDDAGRRFTTFSSEGEFADRPRSLLIVPLIQPRNGECIALLTLDKYDDPTFYTDMHLSVAEIMSPFLSNAVARVFVQSSRWVRIHRLTVVDLIVHRLADQHPESDPEGLPDLLVLSARLIADAFECRTRIAISSTGRPLTVTADWTEEEIQTALSEEAESPQLGTTVVPTSMVVISRQGRRLGSIALLRNPSDEPLDAEDESVLRRIAGVLAPYVDDEVSSHSGPSTAFDLDVHEIIDRATLEEGADGIIWRCNEEFERMVGAPRNDIVGQHFLTFVPEHLRTVVEAQWQQRSNGNDGQYDSVLLRANGTELPVRVHSRPIMEANILQSAIVSFTSTSDTLHVALDEAIRSVRVTANRTPLGVMKAVGAALAGCGLQCSVLYYNTGSGRVSIDYTSLSIPELRRLRRRSRIQIRGTSFGLSTSPQWKTIVEDSAATWWPDPRQLVVQLAEPGDVRLTLARHSRNVQLPPTIVVPALTHPDAIWILATWGQRLRQDDVAAIAAFWREAADVLTEASERTRDQRRLAPKTLLLRRRERVAHLVSPFLEMARVAAAAERCAIYGIRPSSGSTYLIAASPPYVNITLPTASETAGSGAVRLCASTGINLFVRDIRADNQEYLASAQAADGEFRAVATLPIQPDGSRLAVIEFLAKRRGQFSSPASRERLATIQRQAEILLPAASNPRQGSVPGTADGLRALMSDRRRDARGGTALQRYVTLIAEMLQAEECSIWLRSLDDPNQYELVASRRMDPTAKVQQTRAGKSDGIGFTGYVAATGTVICESGDGIRRHRKWRGHNIEQLDRFATGRCDSVVLVPISAEDGQLPTLGVLKCENKLSGPGDPPHFTDEDTENLQRLATHLSSELHEYLSLEHQRRMQLHDTTEIQRDLIHDIRSRITITSTWRLKYLMDSWHEIDDVAKQHEIGRATSDLLEEANNLLLVEQQFLNPNDGHLLPVALSKRIRLKVEQFSLTPCTRVLIADDLEIERQDVADAAYGFISEQLTNVCKHAQIQRDVPDQIQVRVTTTTDRLEVVVSDRGVGIQRPLGENAFRMLRQCIKPVHGTFGFFSHDPSGHGLEVRATIPLNPDEELEFGG